MMRMFKESFRNNRMKRRKERKEVQKKVALRTIYKRAINPMGDRPSGKESFNYQVN